MGQAWEQHLVGAGRETAGPDPGGDDDVAGSNRERRAGERVDGVDPVGPDADDLGTGEEARGWPG